jgi:Na+/melibiose symporter-like transporter
MPVVSIRLFTNRQFVSGAGVTGVMMLAQNGVVFTLPVFLQSVRNLDALHTGLTLFPMSLMILIVSPTAAQLTKRIAHKRLVQAGLIVNTIAILVLRFSIGIDVNLAWLIPGLALYGAGLGLVLSQINNLTLSAVDVKSAGEASGVTNTFRQVGISLGTAIIGAILISTILGGLEGAVAGSGEVPREQKAPISKLLVANSAELAFADQGVFNTLPPAVRGEMSNLRRVSTTAGIRRAFLWCAFFAVLAFGVSMFLPLRPDGQR